MSYQNPPKICPVCKKKANFKFIQDYKNERGSWSLYECSKFWLDYFYSLVPFHKLLRPLASKIKRVIFDPIINKIYRF